MGILKKLKYRLTAPDVFKLENLERLKKSPRFIAGKIELDGHDFHFHDGQCFYDTYEEVISGEMYRFQTSSQNPVILDCGANMGVSVFYFATQYPSATIHAFEPEQPIFDVLQKNKDAFGWPNVHLHQKAVWTSETTLEFFTDKGMGGSVENSFSKQAPVKVQTVRLADYLEAPVAMLKMDIEGAEYTVLKDCAHLLKNVENIFVEYHSFAEKEQHLDDLLTLFKQNNFRYHLRQSFSRKRPMVDKNRICENIDMAINVFAYR